MTLELSLDTIYEDVMEGLVDRDMLRQDLRLLAAQAFTHDVDKDLQGSALTMASSNPSPVNSVNPPPPASALRCGAGTRARTADCSVQRPVCR